MRPGERGDSLFRDEERARTKLAKGNVEGPKEEKRANPQPQ